MEIRRTIEEYLDLETGEVLQAAVFFKQPFDMITQTRAELEKANQGLRAKYFVCAICGGNIRILGGTSKKTLAKTISFHFAHLHNSDDCPIKTSSKYSKEDINRMKYRGVPESHLHIDLKDKIAKGLRLNEANKGQVSGIKLEQVIRSLDDAQWKKPDINAVFNGRRMAIELQLSTTWLDVIVNRQHFYREQGIYILWIFNLFTSSDDFRKLTYSDIIYTNNYNAFIIDAETYTETVHQNDLVLRCWYLNYYADKGYLRNKWQSQLVTLHELTFDEATFQVYYRNVINIKAKAEKEVADYIKSENERQRQLRQERYRRFGEKHRIEKNILTLEDDAREIEQDIERIKTRQEELAKDGREVAKKTLSLPAETLSMYENINSLYFYGSWPDAVMEIAKAYQKKLAAIQGKVSTLKKSIVEKQQQQNRYLALKTVVINHQNYHVLDKSKHWEYILNSEAKLFSYRTDQFADLFNIPKVLELAKHQLDQIRFSAQVLVLTDFTQEIKNNDVLLRKVIKEIETLQNTIATDKEKFILSISVSQSNHLSLRQKNIDNELAQNIILISNLEKAAAKKHKEKDELNGELLMYVDLNDDGH